MSNARVGRALAMALLAACAGDPEDPAAEGRLERECRNRADDDGDGLVDCADDGCAGAAICTVDPPDGGRMDTGDLGPTDVSAGDGDGDGSDATAVDAPLVDVAGDSPEGDAPEGDRADDDVPELDAPGADGIERDSTDPPLGPRRSCVTRIEHRAPGATRVQVAGSFTGWADAPITMTGAGGTFTAEVTLEPGEYPYKFIVDGVWEFAGQNEIPSPAPFLTQWDGGSENRDLVVGDCDVPLLRTVSARGDASGVRAVVEFVQAADGAAVDPETVVVTVGGEEVEPTLDAATGRITIDVSGLPEGKHSIRVWARDTAGRAVEEEPLFVPLWVEPLPFVWQDATMYFVFTDRFRDSDRGAPAPIARPIDGVPEIANYQGGDFKGVIDAIDEGYFDALGVNLLWLSPVQENPEGPWLASDGFHQFSGFHGYWPTHGRQIEFRWGDIGGGAHDRLIELIETAHDHGIRVLFDIPLNHVHQDHEVRGAHPEWFGAAPCPCNNDPSSTCGWDNPIGQLMCWFTSYLPDLDYRNHEIVRQMAADVEWLVTEFDVDGFRIDAAKHMHHVIMRRIALRLDARFVAGGGAPFYLVGETFTGDTGHGLINRYINEAELDGQFDFPLLYPIRDAFAGNGSFRALAARRQISEDQYGDAYDDMSPFLGNHDIPRFSARVLGEPDAWSGAPDPMDAGLNDTTWNLINRLRLGFLFVLTQPGIPLIYYGDELALYGGGDPDNRRMMRWTGLSTAQQTLLDRVRAIGTARRDHLALRQGSYRELWVDDTFYAYARVTGDGQIAIVAMNKGEAGSRNVPIAADLGLDGVTLTDALGGPRTLRPSAGNATFTLGAWECAIFVP